MSSGGSTVCAGLMKPKWMRCNTEGGAEERCGGDQAECWKNVESLRMFVNETRGIVDYVVDDEIKILRPSVLAISVSRIHSTEPKDKVVQHFEPFSRCAQRRLSR